MCLYIWAGQEAGVGGSARRVHGGVKLLAARRPGAPHRAGLRGGGRAARGRRGTRDAEAVDPGVARVGPEGARHVRRGRAGRQADLSQRRVRGGQDQEGPEGGARPARRHSHPDRYTEALEGLSFGVII